MSIIPLTIGQPEPRTERSYRQDSTACGTPAQVQESGEGGLVAFPYS